MSTGQGGEGQTTAADNAVLAAEQRLLFELSSVPSIRIDVRKRQIVAANDAALDLLGWPADEVLGRPGRDFLEDPSPEEVLRVRALQGQTTRLIQRIKTASGPRTCEINMVSVEETGTTFVQVVDLTELLAANRELAHKTEALVRKTRALETVAARVAHDLRSPLSAIAGFAMLLRERGDSIPADKQLDMLERIEVNARTVADAAGHVIEQAMSGELTADVDDAAGALFGRLRAIFDIALESAGATLTTTSDVEQLPHPLEVVLPLVTNLVDNAIKYRAPSRPLTVHVHVSVEGSELTITVDDNGAGVGSTPEALFAEGERGGASDEIVGSGMGLSSPRLAARELGGDVTVEARPVGSRFTIRLPRHQRDHGSAVDVLGATFASGLRAVDLEQAFEVSPVATLLIDLAGPRVVRANTAALALFGTTEDELLGGPAALLLDEPEVAAAMRAEVQRSGHDHRIVVLDTRTGRRSVDAHAAAIPGTTLATVHLIEFPVPADHVSARELDDHTTS